MISNHARLSVAFLLLGSSMLIAQQSGGSSPQPAPSTVAKRHHSNKAKPAPVAMRVDVINGTEKRTQVFHQEESAGPVDRKPVGRSASGRRSKRNTKVEPAATVEIFNGATSYTKTFNQTGDETNGLRTQRANGKLVVVGIANGGATSRNGRLQPVVTRVASSESNSGAGDKQPVVVGIASSGVANGKPVVQSVQAGTASHPPKRQPYRGPASSPEHP
jgi:hypothetical protein